MVAHKTKPPQSAGVIVVTLNLDFISLHRGYLMPAYQNFHQGFLAADLLFVAAVVVAALVTLSFRQPFLSQLNRYRIRQ